ncbi:MAG: hypothetical protein PWQ37_969 [Candidatus Petromonas sp.]|jgi:predicted Zn-dependent peptidase|nr:hypothetical protein [Candidatus Petromonas sp.]
MRKGGCILLTRFNPIELNRSIRFHTIKSDKFKTNLIGIYIQRPLIKKEATKNALLSMVLHKATKQYPTFMEINKKLEDLYGAVMVSDVAKKGERHIIKFKMQLPNKKYIENKNILKEGLEILNEIINNPAIKDGGFIREIFQQEKENLRDKINGRINDKMKYAVDRCVEEMYKDENFSIYEYGNIDDLNEITETSLLDYYKKFIESSPIDIFLIGDVDEQRAKELINQTIHFPRGSIIDIPRENITKDVNAIKEVEDNLNVNQGKLTLGYRTNIPYESNLYEASVLFSNILGGGPNSKLFKNVREKESLCYYIFSKIEKFKSLMLISSGIEFQNYKKTKDIIISEVEDLKKGKFTEDDIEIAKKSIVNSIKSLTDAPNMLIDFYYAHTISGVTDDIDQIIEKIKSVTKESIVEAGEKFKLDTIYFLNSEKEGR